MPDEPTATAAAPAPGQPLSGLIAHFSNAGASGILCWFLYYLVTTTLPQQQERFIAAVQALEARCEARNDKIAQAVGESQKVIAELAAEVRAQRLAAGKQ
jgi:hypothetical protein